MRALASATHGANAVTHMHFGPIGPLSTDGTPLRMDRAGLYHMQFVLGEQSRRTTHTPALYVQSGIGLASIPL